MMACTAEQIRVSFYSLFSIQPQNDVVIVVIVAEVSRAGVVVVAVEVVAKW